MTNKLELAGEWLSLEAFLDKRFGLAISHGLSPEALHRLDGQSESARLLAELSSIMDR
jgi:hypothetical protein